MSLLNNFAVDFGMENTAPVRGLLSNGVAGRRSDLNGNGADDIAFYNNDTGAIGFFSMPSETWTHIGTVGANWLPVRSVTFDYDNDDSMDILWWNVSSGVYGRFDMLNGQNSGWESLGAVGGGLTADGPLFDTWFPIGPTDFDGDGIQDSVFAYVPDFEDDVIGTIKIGRFRKDAQGNETWEGVVSFSEEWFFSGFAQLNDDSIEDMLLVNENTGVIGQFSMGSGGPQWGKIAQMGSDYTSEYFGDFNGDGYDDILAFDHDTGAIGYYDMDGGSASWVGLGSYGTAWEVISTGDYNGDGRDDILFQNYDTNRIGYWEMDGPNKSWEAVGAVGADWELAFL